MNHVFLATTGHGIARAAQADSGAWTIDFLLAEHSVLCFAADPLNEAVVYDLLTDPAAPGHVYAALSNGAV